MSSLSDSEEGSVIDDINPAFKGGSSSFYNQKKSPFKGETVTLMHSKVLNESEAEAEGEGESEDSEFNEDEDNCDEDEQYLRKRKQQLKKQTTKPKRSKPAKQQSESEAEGEEEEDEEESEEVKLEPKSLPQRQSRGKRMNLLVGKAQEEDDAFWGQDFFKEGDEDDSFSADSSEAKDSFDSDFDRSEHSNEGEGDEIAENEKEMRKQERANKKKVKFAIPPKKKKAPVKKPPPIKSKPIEEKSIDEDRSSNTSELLPVARKSKRMQERREKEDSDEEMSEKSDQKKKKGSSNNAQKNEERRREIKEKNKAFLESHGIFGDTQDKWVEILSKDKLTPMEKVQEAVFTEMINKESLNYLQELEDERVNDLVYKDRRPKGPSVKLIQDIKPGHFKSRMVFPSADFYPKNFNTRKEKRKESQRYQLNTCMITGKKARYKDPLTLTPYANKDAFKVVRERFFQKEEDKLNMRIHIINELLNQKRAKLKRFQSYENGVEIPQEQKEVVVKPTENQQQ